MCRLVTPSNLTHTMAPTYARTCKRKPAHVYALERTERRTHMQMLSYKGTQNANSTKLGVYKIFEIAAKNCWLISYVNLPVLNIFEKLAGRRLLELFERERSENRMENILKGGMSIICYASVSY